MLHYDKKCQKKCQTKNYCPYIPFYKFTGQFATKLRTKLDDDTLSSLVFLKAFYKNEAPN